MAETGSKLKPALVYAAAIIIVLVVGGLIGTSIRPDAWYAEIRKPPFNPPNWVFGPVWSILYVMIGVAGARVYLRDPHGKAVTLWIVQMILNWAWTPLWFGLHQMWLAFAVILALWISIAMFIAAARRTDGVAAALFIPYLGWVSFAMLLNGSIAYLNS